MRVLTPISARYGDAENRSVIVTTKEAGDVVVSPYRRKRWTLVEGLQIASYEPPHDAPQITNFAGVPPDMAAILGRVVDAVTDKLTAAEADIASMRAENDQLRREILAWAREQVREVQL